MWDGVETKELSTEGLPNIAKILAMRPNLSFQHGEVGFGRECVGISDKLSESYINLVEYDTDYKTIKEATQALAFSPRDAYHKHACLCVLIHSENTLEEAIKQLEEWCEAILREPSVYLYEGKVSALNDFLGINRNPVIHMADNLPSVY